jgi:lipoyl(octanoyl) transferase
MRTLEVEDLGTISFEQAYNYQKKCVEEIKNSGKLGKLLLLEHTPCITLGVSTTSQDLKSISTTAIPIIKTDRGGKITAHNPGQLTGYPIVNLKLAKLSIRSFIVKVLSIIRQTLLDFGLKTNLIVDKNKTGLWIENRKICFIGIKITHYISYHGFTLNVNNDISIFNLFTPCGIQNCNVTSMQKELNCSIDLNKLKAKVSSYFLAEFS